MIKPVNTEKREFQLTVLLNKSERAALKGYCKKYKVFNRSKLIRELVFTEIISSYSQDYPTLFDSKVMNELLVEKVN